MFSSSADEKTDKTFIDANSVESVSSNAAPEKDDAQTNNNNLSDIPEDFMKSIISEINSAVAEESAKPDIVKDVSGGKKKSSEKTKPKSLYKNVLTVSVENPVLIFELGFIKNEFITKINEFFSSEINGLHLDKTIKIKNIRFVNK